MRRGFFIVFEGGEGAGKSVQVRQLADKLREIGEKVVVTREPGGTRIGEQIRAITHNTENVDLDPVAEAYLMAASRAQHVRETIAPALADGNIVISDRFVDSSIAYQGFGRNLGAKKIAALNGLAVNGAKADIVILLDVPPVVGLARLEKEGKRKDRLDMQQKDFYERVHAGYLVLAKNNSPRYVVVDATKSAEEVAFSIWNIVKNTLARRNEEIKK
ncbi:MAG: dTMP kinase [Candidatus Gottesmanbacteria bacterium]|nr:dTMP kinase [Candidatus Gottesmanbacteria bacterium]